jgi:hypothetical protein
MFRWIWLAFSRWLIQTIVISVAFELVSSFLRGREKQVEEQDREQRERRENEPETV